VVMVARGAKDLDAAVRVVRDDAATANLGGEAHGLALDVGDKVVCLEPADNRLGPDIAGKGVGRRALREHRRQRGAHRRRDLDAGDVR